VIDDRRGEPRAVVLPHAGRAHALEELVQQRLVLDDLLRTRSVLQQPRHVATGAESGKPVVERCFHGLVEQPQHALGIEASGREVDLVARLLHQRDIA
jgi:hypothetical protein